MNQYFVYNENIKSYDLKKVCQKELFKKDLKKRLTLNREL